MTPFRRLMQRSPSELVLGCRVGAVLDEEAGQIHMTTFGRLMQRGPPVLIPGCCVDAVLDEEAG